jgi:hypothetical protein
MKGTSPKDREFSVVATPSEILKEVVKARRKNRKRAKKRAGGKV